ncbi:propionyl-CoA synthetase [Herbaspirillum sp. BH-1]|uniref:Propionyl-CoA synthetase n=1 Tax=Herbaspirillum frisingense TaxID=92645 RepID=A0ABU1PBV4_9BURK|nr:MULTISPECIES: AMP-binding protein [Herbaspirillum]MDR6582838.1 propionyl-CoA synthetase [Herbaspirillum frisingense]PLY60579.1 propionyl-CoA synthetase [Herbaspirillum sp. BH-1]
MSQQAVLSPVDAASSAYGRLMQRSQQDPEGFWREQAGRISWQRDFDQVLDDSRAPFARWFVGGLTNLCHNAVDRHLEARAEQAALICISNEMQGEPKAQQGGCYERVLSYRQLHREVNAMAAILLERGVRRGDRVLVYLPMVAEAAIAMLACARIGAVHAVVFGGFAPASLASRIVDARPALVVCADAGFQNGVAVGYKAWVDQALEIAGHACPVLVVDRGVLPWTRVIGRDHDYAAQRERHLQADVPCVWLESNEPSYLLYTSGTTGQPKGVQRDTGGHAVALATSMDLLFQARPGQTLFTTSDLGWVVGHSYGLYGPLLLGMRSVLYEGSPLRPDASAWWRLVERHGVDLMLSSATAMRLLKRGGRRAFRSADLSSLRCLFLAGEPLDEPTADWLEEALGKPVIDHYWQTETGSPMIGLPLTDLDGHTPLRRQRGSPGLPAAGYRLAVLEGQGGQGSQPCVPGDKGLLVASGVLPPGCLTTLWQRDEQFLSTYWRREQGQWRYATFDVAVAGPDGHLRVLGRADDVINVAGKRLGTREVEEILLADDAVAEVAVIGMPHRLRGQVPMAVVVPRAGIQYLPSLLEHRLGEAVVSAIGAWARPRRIVLVESLPRTRSGKVLRRLMREMVNGELPDAACPPELAALHTLLAGAPQKLPEAGLHLSAGAEVMPLPA